MKLSSDEYLSIVDEQRESSEVVKLIHKLRWIGMEREAEVVARALGGDRLVDTVVAGPSDTE